MIVTAAARVSNVQGRGHVRIPHANLQINSYQQRQLLDVARQRRIPLVKAELAALALELFAKY